MRTPVEIAAVHDQAAEAVAVAAQIFGGRIDDHRRAVIEGPRQQRRRGIVDDQRDAKRPADGRDLGDGENGEFRIGQRLRVIGAGAGVRGAAEILRVRRIDEAHLDALVLQRVREQVPGAAVKIGRADDVIARARDVLDRKGRGRLPRRHRQRRNASLDLGDALLQNVVRGVHEAGVDVPQLLEREQVLGVPGVAELVGGRLMDRHRDRARVRVGPPASVESKRFRVTAFR